MITEINHNDLVLKETQNVKTLALGFRIEVEARQGPRYLKSKPTRHIVNQRK
jgi:hypothetical protein